MISYQQWKREADRRRSALDADPTNVALAKQRWEYIAGVASDYHDLRSYGQLVDIFRACALASPQGAAAFAIAMQTMNDEIQPIEHSQARYLVDPELEAALLRASKLLPRDQRRACAWVYSELGL